MASASGLTQGILHHIASALSRGGYLRETRLQSESCM